MSTVRMQPADNATNGWLMRLPSRQPNPRDRILALLIIVWRLRNNLFHGAKWAYGLRDQRENFDDAHPIIFSSIRV